jgi:predicted ATP-grasp superfamily ATP-dependent carboligase
MTEGTPRPAAVELGVFDLSRLPIQWSNVDPEKLQTAVETIESSVPEQVEQLKQEQKKQSKE